MFLFIAAVVVGASLGLRYKVFVLVPATAIAIVFVALGGIAKGDSIIHVGVTMIAISTVLQVSYIIGTVVEPIMARRLGAISHRYSVSTSAGISKSA